MTPSFHPGRSALALAIAMAGGLSTTTVLADEGPSNSGGKLVITRPGSYTLRRGIKVREPGDAVVITASDVSLDLNGHTLMGPGGKQGVGVRIEDATGVRVHGGIIARFGTGVQVAGSSNVRVEGLQIYAEDGGGPPPGEVGILILNSRGVSIERNLISQTFLGIFVRGAASAGNRIAFNTLTGGANGQIGICYNPDGSGDPTGPSGDLVYNNLSSRWNVGIQTSAGTSGNIFRENALAYFQVAFQEVGANQNVLQDNASIAITP